MNGRDESFSVSIFRKATGKKVDEIVPFTRQRGGRREKTQLLVILSRRKFEFCRRRFKDALTSSRCNVVSFDTRVTLQLLEGAEKALLPSNLICKWFALTTINCSQTNTNGPCIRHGNFASINLISLNRLHD